VDVPFVLEVIDAEVPFVLAIVDAPVVLVAVDAPLVLAFVEAEVPFVEIEALELTGIELPLAEAFPLIPELDAVTVAVTLV
jgi:hypothetical protein